MYTNSCIIYLAIIGLLRASNAEICRAVMRENLCDITLYCDGAKDEGISEYFNDKTLTSDCKGRLNVKLVLDNVVNLGFDHNGIPADKINKIIIKNSNNLQIISAETLTYFKICESLDFSNNAVKEINDYAFDELIHLNSLNLSMNKIDHVRKEMFIQNNVNDKSNITILDFSFNSIKHFNNDPFFYTPKLRELYLQGNEISVVTHDIFHELKELNVLLLSHNKLKRLNNSLIHMSNLVRLDLSHNFLTKLMKNDFNGLKSLRILDLSYNLILYVTGSFSDMLVMKTNLEELYLSNNNLTSFSNSYMYSSNSILVLDVSWNPIEDVNINNLKGLSVLDLSNINLSQLNKYVFPDSLRTLFLNSNNITDIVSESFRNLSYLENLNMSHNFVKEVQYGSFKGLVSLEILDLSNNLLEVIDGRVFYYCDKLKHLYLDNNRIKFLDLHSIIDIAPMIVTLSVINNEIDCEEILKPKYEIDVVNENITSIRKVYNDDIIHGIKCGHIADKNKEENTDFVNIALYIFMIVGIVIVGLCARVIWSDIEKDTYSKTLFNGFKIVPILNNYGVPSYE